MWVFMRKNSHEYNRFCLPLSLQIRRKAMKTCNMRLNYFRILLLKKSYKRVRVDPSF